MCVTGYASRSPEQQPDETRPWWDRALDPLRHEASMFRVLLWVIAIAVVIMAIVLAVRAI